MQPNSPNSTTVKAQVGKEPIPKRSQKSSIVEARVVQEPIPQVSKKYSSTNAQVQELIQWVTQNYTALKAQAGPVQVQQVSMDSSTFGIEFVENQIQQVPRDSSTLEREDVQDQVHEDPLNLEENNLSREQGKNI